MGTRLKDRCLGGCHGNRRHSVALCIVTLAEASGKGKRRSKGKGKKTKDWQNGLSLGCAPIINFCQSEMNTNLFWSAVRVLEGVLGTREEGLVDVFLRLRWWGGAKEGKEWFLYPFQNVQFKLLERVGGGVIIVFEWLLVGKNRNKENQVVLFLSSKRELQAESREAVLNKKKHLGPGQL